MQADLDSFDKVWRTIQERNWDPDFDEATWAAARVELRPKVETAKSIGETREVIGTLIQRLNKSHYAIIPSQLYDKIKPAREGNSDGEDGDPSDDENDAEEGDAGMSFRWIDDHAVVTQVVAGSAAEAAGIEVGWALAKLNDQEVSELNAELRSQLPETSPIRRETLIALALEGKLEGDVGETVELVFFDDHDKLRQVTLVYKPRGGHAVQFGHLPGMRIRSEVRTIANGIGYAWFNLFFDPVRVMQDVEAAVTIAKSGNGLILDLRGNQGGLAPMTMGIGNFFIANKQSYLGTLSTKETNLRFVLSPRAEPYSGPLAVLIDECSISSAEILAGGLQAIERARVFGVRSAGLALPSTVELLPNGDRFQYAFAGYIDSEGRNIEGEGVVPDEPVQPSRIALIAGRDPILEAAIEWIEDQAAKSDRP